MGCGNREKNECTQSLGTLQEIQSCGLHRCTSKALSSALLQATFPNNSKSVLFQNPHTVYSQVPLMTLGLTLMCFSLCVCRICSSLMLECCFISPFIIFLGCKLAFCRHSLLVLFAWLLDKFNHTALKRATQWDY